MKNFKAVILTTSGMIVKYFNNESDSETFILKIMEEYKVKRAEIFNIKTKERKRVV